MRAWTGFAAALVVSALAIVATASGKGGGTVVLVTHDSFAISKPVRMAFEKASGLQLRILQQGDAGTMVNRALLTAGHPEGDVLFGIDDSLLSRALAADAGLFEPYASPSRAAIAPAFRIADLRVSPVDHGEVCLNVDRSFYAGRRGGAPRTLDALTAPRYRGQLVVENPAASSPGLAFLLATIARYGDGWKEYWRKLRANDVLVTDGWEEAYTQQFSGASGSSGKRPIVVSYATSPAAEVIFAGKPLEVAPTEAVEDGCFRQIEYAGILRGTRHPEAARTLLDFLLSRRFQADVPGSMFVDPIRVGTPVPPEFARYAIRPAHPLTLPAERIAAGRDAWVAEWLDIVLH